MPRTSTPGLTPSGGAVADLEGLVRIVIALARVGVWGLMAWASTSYPSLTPAVSGVIVGDLLTWVVRRGVAWGRESFARVLLELAVYVGILIWWSEATVMPTRMEDRGVFGLALLGAIALKTVPAIYLWLHGEE